MAKQVKVGFDKTATRTVETDQVLVDVRGNLLRDESGDFLYTKTDVELPGFSSTNKSMPIVANNDEGIEVSQGGPLPVEEQFPEVSEVSSSLLGIPRQNLQQSLLADVSVYGLDSNVWEFYRNPVPYAPNEWIRRFNPTYGNRYYPRLSEKPDQQALAIEAFPTPWTFPFGPKFEDQGRFDSIRFPLYLKFIQLGNELYQYYVQIDQQDFAEKYFLPPVSSQREDGGGANITLDRTDVEYNADFKTATSHIERWTITWMDIRDGRLNDPRTTLPASLRLLTFQRASVLLGAEYSSSNTRPGYSSNIYYYSQLQSKEAFRYQPGTISGFTFGVSLNFDESNVNNKIEWGCANDTDQYMFQVAGSNFNIIRRSTVPLSLQALSQNGLPEEPQLPSLSPNPFERPGSQNLTGEFNPVNELPRYETVISQDFFNGDPLNGSGPSGYNISFQEVTMYKIEFSWYGAIGAKFYAYIPAGHGECRWVLIHTLIIENTLSTPSLRNPYLHFRYAMTINETEGLREPMYLYKFGASYYIDGADEGSFVFNTFDKDIKEIVSNESRPVIGFQPKNVILNRDGAAIPSQKNFYIDRITAFAEKNVRVDVLECEGCKNGFGHHYAASLVNGARAQSHLFSLQNGSIVAYANTEQAFDLSDNGKKIIAPGIFSTYIYPDANNLSQATIKRRLGVTTNNNEPTPSNFTQSSFSVVNGEEVSVFNTSDDGFLFTGKLYGFDDVASSTLALFKNTFDIRFLNPISIEDTSHYREFRIGVTSKTPSLDIEGNLVFDGNSLDMSQEIFLEFAHFQAEKNMNSAEFREFDPRIGEVMSDDYRLPRPLGSNTGVCSTIKVTVSDTEKNVTYTSINPETGDPGNFIVFEDDPGISLNGGEVGILDTTGLKFTAAQYNSVNITFTSDAIFYTNPSTGFVTIYASISDPLTVIPENIVAFRTIEMSGRYVSKRIVNRFNIFPLYVFIAMHDNAVINNIVIQEYDDISSISHSPSWLIGAESNITVVETGNPNPPASVVDVIGVNEYLGLDGRFYMGGASSQGNPPANFIEKSYLDSIKYDNQISQPLRPGSIKYTCFIGANETIDLGLDHLFGIDRYKVTKGSFNNKSVYINSRVLDSGQNGVININVLGKEQ